MNPIHIDPEHLEIAFNGEYQFTLNKDLLDKHNAWENLELIKKLHQTRLFLYESMKATRNKILLKALDEECTDVEFKLQDAWDFPRDTKFHKFWLRPRCSCPELDNDDRYPTGHYVVVQSCILHGI